MALVLTPNFPWPVGLPAHGLAPPLGII